MSDNRYLEIEELINQLHCANCIDFMKQIADCEIDTIITDPPYGLAFMGKSWDHFNSNKELQEWTEEWATEALRVIKPGGIMLSFAGSRTQHRIACGIEDAGWIIKDTIMWIYGSGFPKALDIGKAVDKKLGNEREKIGKNKYSANRRGDYEGWGLGKEGERIDTKGNTKWEGYKSPGLKPAYEPILLCMKPKDGTYAENVLEHNVGGLNINGARIEHNENLSIKRDGHKLDTNNQGWGFKAVSRDNRGRFPANLILEDCEEVEACFPVTGGDQGSASRYFKRIRYCAKASKKERNKGLERFTEKEHKITNQYEMKRKDGTIREIPKKKNNHPCVKPIELLEYLVELTKMPNEEQVYLDPFLGSGSTAIAVSNKNRNYIGIEKNEEYCGISRARIKESRRQLQIF